MSSEMNDSQTTTPKPAPSGGHNGMFAFLTVGLVVALAGDGFLLVRANHLQDQMAQNQDGTQQQITKLGDATTSLLEQRLKGIDEEIATETRGVQTSAANALRQARAQSQKQAADLSQKLADQQQQVSSQLSDLQTATSAADTKISAVSTDVDGVKTDVGGVKTDLASTKTNLDKTSADLKRTMGDMGVMSGLIATNSTDLQALRQLGERNYIEFDLKKGQAQKKVGDVVISLRKADPKHNRFTVAVNADDKLVEKKDRSTNEPVQLYVHNSRYPDEIVVNQVKKDEIVGYLSTPKLVLARQ
jgi:chromosome segregation ATPase